jgi:hypothetical protein
MGVGSFYNVFDKKNWGVAQILNTITMHINPKLVIGGSNIITC